MEYITINKLTDLVSNLAITGPTIPGIVANVFVIPSNIPAYLRTDCIISTADYHYTLLFNSLETIVLIKKYDRIKNSLTMVQCQDD